MWGTKKTRTTVVVAIQEGKNSSKLIFSERHTWFLPEHLHFMWLHFTYFIIVLPEISSLLSTSVITVYLFYSVNFITFVFVCCFYLSLDCLPLCCCCCWLLFCSFPSSKLFKLVYLTVFLPFWIFKVSFCTRRALVRPWCVLCP